MTSIGNDFDMNLSHNKPFLTENITVICTMALVTRIESNIKSPKGCHLIFIDAHQNRFGNIHKG